MGKIFNSEDGYLISCVSYLSDNGMKGSSISIIVSSLKSVLLNRNLTIPETLDNIYCYISIRKLKFQSNGYKVVSFG